MLWHEYTNIMLNHMKRYQRNGIVLQGTWQFED